MTKTFTTVLGLALFGLLFQTDGITDSRDSQEYSLEVYAGRTWIKENMRFRAVDAGEAVRKEEGQWQKNGAYYSWQAAKKACPEGFHLPTLLEWQARIGTYEGSRNARDGRFVHTSDKDSSLIYAGMVNKGQLRAKDRMGLYWTATDSSSTFGVEGGELKPAYLAIHVYADYVVTDSVNIEPTWSVSADNLFSCKCIKDE